MSAKQQSKVSNQSKARGSKAKNVRAKGSSSKNSKASNHSALPANQKPSATDKALELLRAGVTNIMTSEGWQQALAFKSKFYQYSFFNTSLIFAQYPEASLVAGYKKWLELGRQVKKGEKGISIIAPLISRNRDGRGAKGKSSAKGQSTANNQVLSDAGEASIIGFRAVYVFDVSQTSGEALPQLERPKLLEGRREDEALVQHSICKLLAFAASKQLKVSFDLEGQGALGVYKPLEKAIALRRDLPDLQKLKTFIHELAHALLHDLSSDRSLAELEAESCAFLVCYSLGLDSSQYSFPYLANWVFDLEQLLASGEKASKAAQEIIRVFGSEAIVLSSESPTGASKGTEIVKEKRKGWVSEGGR